MLEELYKNKHRILKNTQEVFLNSISLIPKIGCELEFFLLHKDFSVVSNKILLEEFISELHQNLTKKFPLIYLAEKEQGASQIEIKTHFTSNLDDLCEQLEGCKIFIDEFSKKNNLTSSFQAQPFKDDCGNALQMNISLHNKTDQNILCKSSEYFIQSIAGLLKLTNQMLILLAPKQEDYQRFDLNLNRNLHKAGKYTAPVNLSFGKDNRTTAIRFVEISEKNSFRIEYRVACANADPYLSISAILTAILRGIKEKLTLEEFGYEQIYGNAFDEYYELENILSNQDLALKNFKNFLS